MCIFNSDLETFQVNFAHSSFTHDGIYAVAIGLLVIGSKVFNGCTHTLRLYTIDDGRSHTPGDQRVFRIIFKITATQWITVNIYTGAQYNIGAILMNFGAEGYTYL